VHDGVMTSREIQAQQVLRRARARVGNAIGEIRRARIGAGMSQAVLGQGVDVSRARISRIELGIERQVPVELLVRMASVVGLDLVVRAYPGGDPTLDAAQRRLLHRFAPRIGPAWGSRDEVSLPIPGDQRAWDSVCTHASTGLVLHVEAETRLGDVQALLRRLTLKRRDGGVDRLVLLVADTRHNREVMRAASVEFAAAFPANARRALPLLAAGLDPGADVLLLM
jgi:transcriptional regulator with XRE-family HTH domain